MNFEYERIYIFRSSENSWRWEIALFWKKPKKDRKYGQLATAWLKGIGNSNTREEARKRAQETADALGLIKRQTDES